MWTETVLEMLVSSPLNHLMWLLHSESYTKLQTCHKTQPSGQQLILTSSK
jgi:hypothetical protein